MYRSNATLWRHNRSRSEEHTSELQSQSNLVCRLLLEKKTIEIVSGDGWALIVEMIGPDIGFGLDVRLRRTERGEYLRVKGRYVGLGLVLSSDGMPSAE